MPRPVVTILNAPECEQLPPIPAPVKWGGVPEIVDGAQTGNTLITHDGLADLGGYLDALASWARAAKACLEVKP